MLVLWRQTDQCSFVYLRCRPFAPVIQGLRTGRCAGELQKASRPCGRVAWPSGLRRGLPGADGRRRRRRPWRWRRPPWRLRPCTAMATAGVAVSAVAAAATPTDVDTMYCSDDGGRGGPTCGPTRPPARPRCVPGRRPLPTPTPSSWRHCRPRPRPPPRRLPTTCCARRCLAPVGVPAGGLPAGAVAHTRRPSESCDGAATAVPTPTPPWPPPRRLPPTWCAQRCLAPVGVFAGGLLAGAAAHTRRPSQTCGGAATAVPTPAPPWPPPRRRPLTWCARSCLAPIGVLLAVCWRYSAGAAHV